MGEALPIFTHNKPEFEKDKNLRALVAPVEVELAASRGSYVLGTYQIEPLTKIEAVRRLILCSAPMDGPNTAAYRRYCTGLTSSRIMVKLHLKSAPSVLFHQATVVGCEFVNSVPVHSLQLDPTDSESGAELDVVLAAIEYRILEQGAVEAASAEAEAPEEEADDDEVSYSVRISLESAQALPPQFKVCIIKPDFYETSEFWQAVHSPLAAALLAGGKSYQDRGWESDRQCWEVCDREIKKDGQGCVARHLSREQVCTLSGVAFMPLYIGWCCIHVVLM